ncbi:hypothetical protein ACIQOV_17115, partial [Kitasatospora sp. NPDC091257]|uniref:hypothetical protein n=1 Tax=Kitasatospora sp. NPDC091257 TaxID=3364084 RepID=UPI003830D5C1
RSGPAAATGRPGAPSSGSQAEGGIDYAFVPGTFYRVNAAAVIDNVAGEPFSGAHSDIRKPQVATLAAAAAAAHG